MAKLIYKKAGNIELIRRSDSARFLSVGVVESIEPSISRKSSTLPDGNSDWDMEFSNGMEGQVAVNLSTFLPKLYAGLAGATYDENSSYAIRHITTQGIPAASPFTVDVSAEGAPLADPVPVVHDAADSPYVKVSASPAAGQFAVSGSVFTFCSANANEEVTMAFDVTTTADKMELPSESNRPVFEMIIAGKAVLADDEGTSKADTMVFDSVAVSGDLKPPARKREPVGWNFTMKILKPRAGRKPVDYRVER
ncbi:MAG: hypothetical protein WC102_11715 [Saccharofermentanales bacterium]